MRATLLVVTGVLNRLLRVHDGLAGGIEWIGIGVSTIGAVVIAANQVSLPSRDASRLARIPVLVLPCRDLQIYAASLGESQGGFLGDSSVGQVSRGILFSILRY